jgi:hypothetical protein
MQNGKEKGWNSYYFFLWYETTPDLFMVYRLLIILFDFRETFMVKIRKMQFLIYVIYIF